VAALSHALTYADAVIIESLGNGNGLTSPAIEQRVMDAANAGKMMILSSQVPQHLLDSSYAAGLLNSSMASSLLPSYNWPFSALYVRALAVASLYPAQDRAERWQCSV
jgi:L-asparaginase/Glu-tRNA(Gln) amidotransferase subunit D